LLTKAISCTFHYPSSTSFASQKDINPEVERVEQKV